MDEGWSWLKLKWLIDVIHSSGLVLSKKFPYIKGHYSCRYMLYIAVIDLSQGIKGSAGTPGKPGMIGLI